METGKTSAFPYPARKPGGCRFASDNENVNFQEYGEVPVVMAEGDFESWWFFYEDSDKPGMSRVGMDRQNRCILERNDYKELIAKLDRLVPLTGDPARDGCPPLLPPQELQGPRGRSRKS